MQQPRRWICQKAKCVLEISYLAKSTWVIVNRPVNIQSLVMCTELYIPLNLHDKIKLWVFHKKSLISIELGVCLFRILSIRVFQFVVIKQRILKTSSLIYLKMINPYKTVKTCILIHKIWNHTNVDMYLLFMFN